MLKQDLPLLLVKGREAVSDHRIKSSLVFAAELVLVMSGLWGCNVTRKPAELKRETNQPQIKEEEEEKNSPAMRFHVQLLKAYFRSIAAK